VPDEEDFEPPSDEDFEPPSDEDFEPPSDEDFDVEALSVDVLDELEELLEEESELDDEPSFDVSLPPSELDFDEPPRLSFL